MKTVVELRRELDRQAQDRPDPAGIRGQLRAHARRRRNGVSAVIAAAVVAILAGVFWVADPPATQPAKAPTISVPITVWELQCEGSIGAAATPEPDYTVVAGVVAFNTTMQTPNFDDNATGNNLPYFAKSGLLIKTGTPFTVTVDQPLVGDARIGWSNISVTPADQMQVPSCPRVGQSADAEQWLAYPGGIWVSEPMCVHLTVSTTKQSAEIRIPVGAPC